MQTMVIAHNIRSIHNLGSIFRTSEGFGVEKIILSGYTPNWHDGLPHVQAKMAGAIHKTALGAETMVASEYVPDLAKEIAKLKSAGWIVVGLEQDERSTYLADYHRPEKVVLLLGEEVHGIEPEFRDLCDDLIEIPMHGKKESFNVSVATGIALYVLTTN
jgi:tRNA G18 (ribose-2'-O)-methylase SpoU